MTQPASARHFSLSSHSLFWLLWAVQSISILGSYLSSFALSFTVMHRTGSASLLAWVSAASTAGIIYCAPFAAHLIDRLGHRQAAMTASCASAGLSAIMVALISKLGHGHTGLNLITAAVVFCVFCSGVLSAIMSLTLASSIRLMRREADLMRVNGILTLVDNGPILLGPMLGAALYSLVGPSVMYVLDAATFALTFVLVWRTGWGRDLFEQTREGPRGSLREGFAFVFSRPALRNVQLLYLALNICNGLTASVLLLAIYASARAHHQGEQWWIASSQGLGALGSIVGGLLIARYSRKLSRLTLFAGGLAIAALGGRVLPVLSTALIIWCITMFARNFGLQMNGTCLTTVWQEQTPPHLQASVAGARKVLGQGAYPPAVIAGGALAAHLSNHWGALAADRGIVIAAGCVELLVLAAYLASAENRDLFRAPTSPPETSNQPVVPTTS